MTDKRKIELFANLLDLVAEMSMSDRDLIDNLRNLGFTDDEIKYEFDWFSDDMFDDD